MTTPRRSVRLVLASASPRRSELLRAAGFEFDINPAHVDEAIRAGESASVYVRRVAEHKAQVIGSQSPERAVLAADTVVVVDDQILGKPQDADDARRMLRLLSGRTHQVMTGVCLWQGVPDGAARTTTHVAVTAVEFATLAEAEIAWYVDSGEPMDKAGAYAIQGLASRFVTRIDGSYSNVVGLPVALVYEMCSEAGMLLS